MQQKKISITKAKLNGEGKLSVSYNEKTTDGDAAVTMDCTAEPHSDLVGAFTGLNSHLAAICQQYDKEGKISDKVTCRGFTLKGEDDNAGFVLSGLREVANNKSFAINTPFMRWESDKDNYANMDNLESAISECIDEVKEYLLNDKHAPDPQGQLFSDTDEQVTEIKTLKVDETPENIINEMIAKLGIEEGMSVMVPVGRRGEIIKSILTSDPDVKVTCFNLLADTLLTKKELKNVSLPDVNFLTTRTVTKYDRVVCQPVPGQDIDYVYSMHDNLNPGGRLIAVIPASVMSGKGKTVDVFRQFLEKVKAIQVKLENGAFSEDGNPVPTVMVIIDRPAKGSN